MKNKILQFMLLLAVTMLFIGCATARPSDPNRLVPNYTWNWPNEGIVRDMRQDPEREIHIFLAGNYTRQKVSDRLYWLDIEAADGIRTWVLVEKEEWAAARIDTPWQRQQKGMLAKK